MKTAFIVFTILLAGVFFIIGLLVSIWNWWQMLLWAYRKYCNGSYNNKTIPNYFGDKLINGGAMLISIGLIIASPVMPLGLDSLFFLVVLSFFIIDFGSFPCMVITPYMLEYFFRRKAYANRTKKQTRCWKLQIDLPLLFVGNDGIPLLISSVEELSQQVMEPGSVLYSEAFCQRVVIKTMQCKSVFLRRSSKAAFQVEEAVFSKPRPYKFERLRKLQSRLIRRG